MTKKLFDFGVVTFDSDYNPEYNRFHVRAEIEYVISSVLSDCSSSTPIKTVKFKKMRVEITRNGKLVEYDNSLRTVYNHSELRDNPKFLKLYEFCSSYATVTHAEAKKILQLLK